MAQPLITVIAGGKPDDSFAQSKPKHLAEVSLAPTPATATVTTFPRSRTLRIVDAIIGLIMRLRARIERADQARPQA